MKNDFLDQYLEKYSQLSNQKGRDNLMESFKTDFEKLSAREQEQARKQWLLNIKNVEHRLQQIDRRIAET
ncbi:MAG: hypothetical protein AAGG68_06700 [Bacteroidota bacterium]